MNIIITLLVAPLLGYLLYKKNDDDLEHGSFISLLITPAMTIISLLIAVYGFSISTTVSSMLIVAFIVFSLVGDVYNALKEDYLLFGLIYFAIGHLLLIVAAFILCDFGWINIIVAILLFAFMGFLYLKFQDNLEGIMEKAVPVYMGLATLSVIFAVTSGSFFFTVGVLAFYLSDVFLGTRLFWQTEEVDFHANDWLRKGVWYLYAPGIYLIANSIMFM